MISYPDSRANSTLCTDIVPRLCRYYIFINGSASSPSSALNTHITDIRGYFYIITSSLEFGNGERQELMKRLYLDD